MILNNTSTGKIKEINKEQNCKRKDIRFCLVKTDITT